MAGSRLLVQRTVYEPFLEKLVAFVATARLGDPRDPATNIGPIATRPQYRRVLDYIEIAKAEGARLVFGGHAVTAGPVVDRGSGARGDTMPLPPGIAGGYRRATVAPARRHRGVERGRAVAGDRG